MLRKTLTTLVSVAALGVGSAAMAAHGGGGGGGGGGGMMHGGPMTAAPMTRGPMTTGPITGRGVQGWNGRTAWGGRFHDHFHHRFHNRNFFAFGFGGPIYDYAYDSCWSWVPTRSGWQWVYVCGDYY